MARLLLPLFLIMVSMLPGYFARSFPYLPINACYISCMSCIMISSEHCLMDSAFPSGSEFCKNRQCYPAEVTRQQEAIVVILLMNCRTSINVDNCARNVRLLSY